MVEYSKLHAKLSNRQLKQLKTAVGKNSENDCKNTWWKWFASWIVIDNKTKGKAKKCI